MQISKREVLNKFVHLDLGSGFCPGSGLRLMLETHHTKCTLLQNRWRSPSRSRSPSRGLERPTGQSLKNMLKVTKLFFSEKKNHRHITRVGFELMTVSYLQDHQDCQVARGSSNPMFEHRSRESTENTVLLHIGVQR